jgi:hypothetical protein
MSSIAGTYFTSPSLIGAKSDAPDLQSKRATRPGLEPGTREPKSLVLPLHHRVVAALIIPISPGGIYGFSLLYCLAQFSARAPGAAWPYHPIEVERWPGCAAGGRDDGRQWAGVLPAACAGRSRLPHGVPERLAFMPGGVYPRRTPPETGGALPRLSHSLRTSRAVVEENRGPRPFRLPA